MIENGEAIERWLVENDRLGEALLSSVVWKNFGYSIEFGLDHPLKNLRVQLLADGVERFVLDGGLTATMMDCPERIDWGLSEIAKIAVNRTSEGLLHTRIEWEGARRIRVESKRLILTDQCPQHTGTEGPDAH